jgi:branched-chain amino acid transport system permease protein
MNAPSSSAPPSAPPASAASALPAYRIQRATRLSRGAVPVVALVIVALILYPVWAGSDAGANMRLVVEICYYLALAQTWNLLAGYAGLVSVGQQAYVGLGSYGFFLFALLVGVPPLPSLLLAGLGAAILAVPTALIVFRLRGAYFAIGTWVVAEVYRLLLALVKPLGGGTGMSLPVAITRAIADNRSGRELIIYYIGLAIGIGSVLLVFLVLRSRRGLALTAIRDSEAAAASVGVDNRGTKLAVYVISAFAAGLVGALVAVEKLRVAPDAAFSVGDWTVNVIFIVVIGGIGSIEGPILGTLVFFGLRALLADYGAWYLVMLGVVAVVVMLKAPRGLWGLIADRFDLQFFPVQRRVRLTAGS